MSFFYVGKLQDGWKIRMATNERCCGLQKKCAANDLEDNRRNSPLSSNHQGLSMGVYLCPLCVLSGYHSESYKMLSKCPSELSSVKQYLNLLRR